MRLFEVGAFNIRDQALVQFSSIPATHFQQVYFPSTNKEEKKIFLGGGRLFKDQIFTMPIISDTYFHTKKKAIEFQDWVLIDLFVHQGGHLFKVSAYSRLGAYFINKV